MEELSPKNLEAVIKYSPTRTLPLMQAGEYNISGTIPITKYLLSLNESIKKVLLGENQNQISSIDMWIDFVNFKIRPFYEHLIAPIFAAVSSNEEISKIALEDLSNIMNELNQYLSLKSFLVEHSVTLADIFLVVNLYPYFTLLFNEKKRSEIPNVTRLYFYVANLKMFTNIFGICKLCNQVQKNSVIPLTKLMAPISIVNNNTGNKNQNSKPSINNEKKIENKKTENKQDSKKTNSSDKPVKPVVTANADNENEEKEDKRKKNELDLLPPSKFELDPFKKEFMNSKDKAEVLKGLWEKYDPEGYSLWHIHYQKCGDQGKMLFKTANLKTLFLQKLDKFRRYSFAVHGVYGTEPDLEVEGVWMWRGKDIPSLVRIIYILLFKNIFKNILNNDNVKFNLGSRT